VSSGSFAAGYKNEMPHQLHPPGASPLVAVLRLAGSPEAAALVEETLVGANRNSATAARTGRSTARANGRHLHWSSRRHLAY
jgi:hypothetical protein